MIEALRAHEKHWHNNEKSVWHSVCNHSYCKVAGKINATMIFSFC